MHEPMSAELIVVGQPLSFASAPTRETVWAKSGEWGPLSWGSSADRSMRMTSSKKRSGSPSGSAAPTPST